MPTIKTKNKVETLRIIGKHVRTLKPNLREFDMLHFYFSYPFLKISLMGSVLMLFDISM